MQVLSVDLDVKLCLRSMIKATYMTQVALYKLLRPVFHAITSEKIFIVIEKQRFLIHNLALNKICLEKQTLCKHSLTSAVISFRYCTRQMNCAARQ